MAVLGGKPLIAWIAEGMAPHVRCLTVSAPDASGAASWARDQGMDVVQDGDLLAGGPLAGVAAGLAWANARSAKALIVLPCDTPFAPRCLPRLLAHDAAYAASHDGLHPLCAVLPVERALKFCADWDTHPPVRAFLERLGARPVVFEDLAPFRNINRPEDLPAFEKD